MSKSIYEETLKELTWLVHDEFDETPKRSMLNASQRLDMFKKVRDTLEQAQKQEKLLELYKQAYDKSNAEVLKMFTYEQDEKTTLTNIIGHLDDSETVVQIKELENE